MFIYIVRNKWDGEIIQACATREIAEKFASKIEDSYAYLSQFQEMEDDYLYIDTSDTTYDCCEPFIGQLPSICKEC